MSVEELMSWLSENSNEWSLEVNGHAGNYESREDYVKWGDLNEWHESLNEGPNLYRMQVYPNTPVSCYILFGTDLREVLEETVVLVKESRLDGSKPFRFDEKSRSK